MELHNILIGAFYLLQVVGVIKFGITGRARVGKGPAVINGFIFILLTASIFATGDPSSWQAVILMLWWALNTLYGMTLKDEWSYLPDSIGARIAGMGFVLVFMILPLFLLGINIPSGV